MSKQDAAQALLEAAFVHLAAFADAEYVRGCHISQRDECKGWEHKAKTGKFGQAEYEAHKQFDEAMGAHFGIYKAIKSARAALALSTFPHKEAA